MTDEKMAEKSFFEKDLTYKVSRDERSYKEGFLEGLKAGAERGYEQGLNAVLSKLSHHERMKVRPLLLAEVIK